MDENLRDQVHKWRDERKQKMMQRITNNSKTQLSSAVLGVKPSSSSTITLPQSNKEKRLPKKPPTEIRQTKTSAKRRLLANPLLEPKNVEFIQEMQRRDTLCVEKSQKDGSKVTVRDTHKEQTLKAMCHYDLNGRRLTVSTNDLSKLGLAKRAFGENPIGSIVKCKNSEIGNNTNSKRNGLKCNGSTESGNTYSAKQHRRSQSWQNIRSISVTPKFPRLCNNELAEFEQQYCKTDIEESQLPDRTNTLSNNKRETMILRKGNLPSSNLVHESRRMTFLKTSSEDRKTSVPRGLPRQPNCSLSTTLNGKKVSLMQNRTSASVNRRKVEKQLTVRRSLSQEHLQRKKLTVSTKRRSSSTEDLNKLCKQVRFVSPIIEETSSLLLVDSSVPASGQSGRPSFSTPCNSSSNLHSREQKRKLLKWLSEKGKPLDTYKHLQCFNIPGSDFRIHSAKIVERNRCPPQIPEEEACGLTVEASFDEGNKENIWNTPAGKKELDEPQLKKVTCEALIDLRGLVAAGYDHDECEAWMELLTKRCPKICDYVEYWECLASLDEARGDYNMAVDCYQRAIVRGAEVDDINKQLDSLLSKMDDLNLETPCKDRTASPRSKVDIKNICKSKVIQFALQQKVVKRLGEDLGVNTQTLYVATPVRRSTRKSLYDPRCLKTLDDLDPEKKYLTEFQPNPAFK